MISRKSSSAAHLEYLSDGLILSENHEKGTGRGVARSILFRLLMVITVLSSLGENKRSKQSLF